MDTSITLIFTVEVVHGQIETDTPWVQSGVQLEAVRRVLERTASGVSIAQLGRELDVRPDLLRAWVRQAQERSGAALPDVFPGRGRLSSD
jgi:hypothetical protein